MFILFCITLALLCPSLNNPLYGSISCPSGHAFGASCSFECNLGYDMIGIDVVQCLSNQQWNDTLPFCIPKTCSELIAPANTILVEPCYSTVNFTCTLFCDVGYYIEGIGAFNQTCVLSESGEVQWSSVPVCQGNYLCYERHQSK